MLNKQKGNMYGFVTHTWNAIKGKCPHHCVYCYMNDFPQGDFRFDAKSIKDNLGTDNFIFVGSSTDMWAKEVPAMWIEDTLELCFKANNHYLFQSKNPARFCDYWSFPPNMILGTTIESNRCCCDFTPSAPCISERYLAMKEITKPKMVSIEPIMDFDLNDFAGMIRDINPEFVSIGADSKNHNLPEPSGDKVRTLISELEKFTKVKQKDNLKRLLPEAR